LHAYDADIFFRRGVNRYCILTFGIEKQNTKNVCAKQQQQQQQQKQRNRNNNNATATTTTTTTAKTTTTTTTTTTQLRTSRNAQQQI
jgi:hypothetical protein